MNNKFMKRAIELSIKSVNSGTGPFGALIVKDNKVISEGFNTVTLAKDPTSHAECTVVVGELINNEIKYKAINSCITLLPTIQGKQLILVEDLISKDGSLHQVQKAMVNYHGSQCGFCTPGMVMAAADLLKTNSKPTELEIREHLEGNICRCTGYHNIVKAILAASGQDVSNIAAE